MREFRLLLPAALREEHYRGVVFQLQVEGQLGADPLLCTVKAVPFDASLRNEVLNLPIVEAFIAESKLINAKSYVISAGHQLSL